MSVAIGRFACEVLRKGAPVNNAAWNGHELVYRLMLATPVIGTNTRSMTTNLIGMRVTVEDSWG
ncbi:MAG: hypothetical protein GX803_06305 [Lentisphaerae bacterium]|jgi:hypothetical protein|nr:hypothetical protein [Lentisphaerota bacterium]